jgi:hypothetical protein
MDSARAFATRHVGGVFYRRSGLQHYLERLFGLPDEEVGAEFAEQRMGFLSRLSLARSVGREIARLWAAARIHPMMEDLGTDRVLVRPREGFSAVFAILEEQLAAAGVEVCLDTQIRGVHRRGGRFSIRTSRGDELFGSVASTIPVDTLLQAMGEDQDEPLERMSLLSLFYRGRLLPDAGSLYNFTPRGGWKRLAIFSKFYGREEGEDYFTVEITTRETDEPTKAALRADFEQHVRDLELFAGDVRWVGDCVSQDAYPVLRRGCKALAEDRRRRLQSQGIRLAGRQGRFEYSNVETCVRQAQALVESMAQAARP